MLKCVLGLLVALSTVAIVDVPQIEAGPLRNLIARGVERRQSRRAEGRGFLPGVVIRHRRAAHSSCGTQAVLSGGCPSCPSSTVTTTTVKDCPSCPNGVCPKP